MLHHDANPPLGASPTSLGGPAHDNDLTRGFDTTGLGDFKHIAWITGCCQPLVEGLHIEAFAENICLSGVKMKRILRRELLSGSKPNCGSYPAIGAAQPNSCAFLGPWRF